MIEILVALGIAGTALILLLSGNNASLRRSVASREELRLLRAAESKYEECILGIEQATSGELEGFPGWRWEVSRAPASVAPLKKLKRVTFRANRPEGARVFEWGGFLEAD